MLTQRLKDYANHELTIVTDMWDHANHFDWARDTYTPHVNNLIDTRMSTQTLESMMGVMKDRNTRDGTGNDYQSHHRIFFSNTQLQKRVDVEQWPVHTIARKEMVCYKTRRARTGDWHFDQRRANAVSKKGWKHSELIDRLHEVEKSGMYVKPTGLPADARSVAASINLTQLRPQDFQGIEDSWLTVLLSEGEIFKDKSTGVFYVCTKNYGIAAWFHETEDPRGRDYFVPVRHSFIGRRECIERTRPIVITDIAHPSTELDADNPEKFVGVPTTPCDKLSLQLIRSQS